MRTEHLIDVLAARADPVPQHATERRLAMAALGGIGAAAILMLVAFGVRPDIESAARLPMFWIKLLFPAVVAVFAAMAAARLARPGARVGAISLGIALPFVALWLMAAVALITAEPDARGALILGTTWTTCLRDIALLAVPAFAATFWAMRGLAPTQLALSGAVSGLLAGAIGAVVYALLCPEMASPFIAVWYVAGIGVCAAAGALAGPRLLRW
jgi:hypothetical protein